MVPENLVQHWEYAYQRYRNASKAASVAPGDLGAAREMSAASSELAAMWRAMESTPDLPWWAVAALAAAGQAFEFQARDWIARADYAWPPEITGPRRPQVRLTTRAKPNPRHVAGDPDE